MFVGKVLIICGLVLFLLRRIRTIRKTQVFLLLFILWSIAFLYSPYWYAFGTFGFPNLRYVAFFILLLFGILWAFLSASKLQLPKFQIHIIPLSSLGLILYFVNYKQLNADIPWRGDEDAHITILLRLKEYLTYFWTHLNVQLILNPLIWISVTLLIFLVYLRIQNKEKKIYKALVFSSILLVTVTPSLILFFDRSLIDLKNIFYISDVLIYPYIQKWINFIFLIPNYYDVSHYRIVPFLSLIGISSFLYYKFYKSIQSKSLAFLFSLAFSTIPLLLYYSSLLYLEMPLIFLLLICIWNIKSLIKDDFDALQQHFKWYVLLILSLLKETTIIFLLPFVFLRMFYQLYIAYKTRVIRQTLLFSEMKLVFTVLYPVILFILFRKTFIPYFDASHSFYWDKLISVSNYEEIARSLVSQTGVLPVIGVLGLVYLSKRDFFTAKVLLLIFLAVLFFFFIYLNKFYLLIVGYSRWNLYLLPMLLFAAAFLIVQVVKSRKIYGVFLLAIILVFNIALFPFNSDGTRLPGWGAPRIDVGEYTYPYNEAVRYLSIEKAKTVLLLGQYSQYLGLRFYFEKYNFYPNIREYYFGSSRFDANSERQKLDQFFETIPHSADAILYHSVNNINLDKSIVYGGKYIIAKKAQNSVNSIYIFIDKKI